MWTETNVFKEDMEQLSACKWIPWQKFYNKTFLVTGATGLLGASSVSALLYYSQKYNAGIRVIALVRSLSAAQEKFRGQLSDGCELILLEGSLEAFPQELDKLSIDYIVHCAAPTGSAFFVSNPVDTINAIVLGTRNILELAKEKKISGMVYLSSMEVYGEIKSRKILAEQDIGYIDPLSLRSSYPEGKRLAETLCCAYAGQYDVPVRIVRLAQCFGPGVNVMDDQRVFAYMARCAIAGQDIVLKTSGTKENMYLYTMDAVSAVLLLLTQGRSGEAYNVANESTYCSIKEMAQIVIETLGTRDCKLHIGGGQDKHFRPEGFLNLDTSRLKALGWCPYHDLREMYIRMTDSIQGVSQGR